MLCVNGSFFNLDCRWIEGQCGGGRLRLSKDMMEAENTQLQKSHIDAHYSLENVVAKEFQACSYLVINKANIAIMK